MIFFTDFHRYFSGHTGRVAGGVFRIQRTYVSFSAFFIILAEDGIPEWAKDSKLEPEKEMKRLEQIPNDAKTEGIYTIKPEKGDVVVIRF